MTHYTLGVVANSPARSSVDVGTVIADTYTIEALLGQGGMGSVFLASHTRLPGKRVAIKLLHVDLTDEDLIARFRREALIASRLDHPNIVRVDDYNVTADGTPYLVLEYLEGQSLAERLRAGPLPLEKVESIVRMVGSAVAAAHHQGIIHRDLKPQNIFLTATEIEGSHVEVAKVLDFGISKMRGHDTVKTQESTLLGTPQYMAPEQATGNHAAVDERTDVFALGAIVYEMLSGQPAFSGENIPVVVFQVVYEQPPKLAELAPDTPPAVIAAIEKAMAKQSAERFASVSDFVEALTGRPLPQRATSMISIPPRDPATPSKRTGQAFANTIDSGNVPASQARKRALTPVTVPSRVGAVSPQAETVASQAGEERSPTAPPIAPPRRRPLIVALAATSVLAIGVAIFFATRHDETRAPAVATDAAVAIADAASPADALVAVVPTAEADAAIAVEIDAAVATDAAVAAKNPPKKPPTTTIDRSAGDPGVWASLDKGEAAYRAGDYDLAIRQANSVINQPAATPTQESLAYVLRGAIHCKHNNNIGLAQADLRSIKVAGLRSRLIKRCADDAKIDLE